MILPYVYILTHKTTQEFYIGYRYKNKVASSEDLGKVYFSSCSRVKDRFSEFEPQVIAEFFDPIDAFAHEQCLIKEHFKDPLCLNRVYQNTDGKRFFIPPANHSEEAKKKIGAASKKRVVSEETRQKMSLAAKSRTHSPETKKKISEIQKGKKLSQESIRKRSETVRGRKRSEETKKKISDAQKGRKFSEEHLQKIADARAANPWKPSEEELARRRLPRGPYKPRLKAATDTSSQS